MPQHKHTQEASGTKGIDTSSFQGTTGAAGFYVTLGTGYTGNAGIGTDLHPENAAVAPVITI